MLLLQFSSGHFSSFHLDTNITPATVNIYLNSLLCILVILVSKLFKSIFMGPLQTWILILFVSFHGFSCFSCFHFLFSYMSTTYDKMLRLYFAISNIFWYNSGCFLQFLGCNVSSKNILIITYNHFFWYFHCNKHSLGCHWWSE